MSAAAGALLGLSAGLGLLLVIMRLPATRRLRLADRIAPYVRPAALLSPGATVGSRPGTAGGAGGVLRLVAGRLDRLLGGREALAGRLVAAGADVAIEQYRVSQVLWAAFGAMPGVLLLAAGAGTALPRLSLAGLALVVAGVTGGVATHDAALGRAIRLRNAAMLAELPSVADLLSLAVAAGESPLGALQRVSRGGDGPLRQELRHVLGDVHSGAALVQALDDFAARSSVPALARFLDGLVVAIERGTPLSDVLRYQAADVREAAKRELIEAGGRKEIAMMVPVVFLVLPTTVLFAAFPAFTSLTFLAP